MLVTGINVEKTANGGLCLCIEHTGKVQMPEVYDCTMVNWESPKDAMPWEIPLGKPPEMLYFGETEEGIVYFLAYNGPSHGFGGARITINVKGQGPVTLEGPWSSRCSVMNAAGFPPSIEVTFVEGGMRRFGYITVKFAVELLRRVGLKYHFEERRRGGEVG